MTPAGLEMLGVHAPVLVRVANEYGREFPSRIENLESDAIVIGSPAGAGAALLASGARNVDVSWLSPRGRYEQRCVVIEHTAGGARQWRLRPLRRPVLIQRRRYIRVTASVPVRVVVDGEKVLGTTIDISEGGFRVHLPRRTLPELSRTTVHATMGSAHISSTGFVLRVSDTPNGGTDVVIAFEAESDDATAIRRFVLNAQLRARASRTASIR
jgi:c-di-GMP-binding flagellar brake protein YcgR